MNFKLKGLVAAAILAASVPAHAAIDNGLTGNGSMILNVVDFGNSISASFDLGKNYSDFSSATLSSFANSGVTNSGTAFSWDLTSADYSAAWSAFTAVANLASAKWFVAGNDNTGAGAGARGYVSTYAGTPVILNTNQMGTAVSSYDTFINNLNMHGNNSTVANGASSAGASAYDYVGKVLSTTLKLNGAGANVAGSFDSALGVAQVTTGASSFANANQFVFGNGAKFLLSSTGQLAYSTTAVVAPVPEADTWAMMAAGLGLMGFIGRRRMKA